MSARIQYWVTEEFLSDGKTAVTGIYTSVNDLAESGLRLIHDGSAFPLRISLVKLDWEGAPVGTWLSSEVDEIAAVMATCVANGTVTQSEMEFFVSKAKSL